MREHSIHETQENIYRDVMITIESRAVARVRKRTPNRILDNKIENVDFLLVRERKYCEWRAADDENFLFLNMNMERENIWLVRSDNFPSHFHILYFFFRQIELATESAQMNAAIAAYRASRNEIRN